MITIKNKSMTKQIRMGVFETNSSSTHSMVICTKEEYEKWKNGEYVYVSETYGLAEEDKPTTDFITAEQAEILLKKGAEDYYFKSFNKWEKDLEQDVNTYTTKNGEELVIRCAHGYN